MGKIDLIREIEQSTEILISESPNSKTQSDLIWPLRSLLKGSTCDFREKHEQVIGIKDFRAVHFKNQIILYNLTPIWALKSQICLHSAGKINLTEKIKQRVKIEVFDFPKFENLVRFLVRFQCVCVCGGRGGGGTPVKWSIISKNSTIFGANSRYTSRTYKFFLISRSHPIRVSTVFMVPKSQYQEWIPWSWKPVN